MSIWGDVISGIGGIGATIGSAVSAAQSSRAMKKIARENRAWAERMDNTKHAREVTDLRNAGLNPLLSSMHSAGSVPSVPSSPNQPVGDFSGLSEAGRAIGAVSARKLERQQLQQQKEMFDSNISLNSAKAASDNATADAQTALADFYRSNTALNHTRNVVENLGIASAKNADRFANSKTGKVLDFISRVSQAVQGVSGATNSAMSTVGNVKDAYNLTRHGVVPMPKYTPARIRRH